MKALSCYSWKDLNGDEYFVYYSYYDEVYIMKLRSWGNIIVAKFKVKKWNFQKK